MNSGRIASILTAYAMVVAIDTAFGSFAFGQVRSLLDNRGGDDRWRGITVGEFEQRRLKAIREELDRAHAERVRPAVRSSVDASAVRLSSKART
jgi:hypothetical protein